MDKDSDNDQSSITGQQSTIFQPPSSLTDNLIQDQPTTPQPIQEIVSTMQTIETDTPEAKLNASSMDDNNGDRIEFNEDHSAPNRIK